MLSRVFTRREQLVLTLLALAVIAGSLTLYLHDPADARTTAKDDRDRVSPPQNPDHIEVTQAESPPEQKEHQTPEPASPVEHSDISPAAAPETTRIRVSVAGAVARPGLYDFEEGSRIQDLLDEAGGALDNADLSDINVAAELIDASTLVVPSREPHGDSGGIIRRPRVARSPNPPEYTISGWEPRRNVPPVRQEATMMPSMVANAATEPATGLIDVNTAGQDALETLPGIGPKLAQRIIEHRASAPFRSVEELADVSGIGTKRLEAIRHLVTVN